MRIMDRTERIAKRILASVYSWYTIEDGRAYVFLDKHTRPKYYVCRNASNSYRVIKFDGNAFASRSGRNMLNAILVALKSGNDKMLDAFGEYLKWDRNISAGKAVAPLLDELGMSLPDFENLFHTQTDFTSGSGLDEREHGKWRIVFEKGTRDPEQVIPLLDKVDGMLGGFSKALSYGIVEIKNDMPPKVLADYNPKNDSMRVKSDSSDGRIFHSFIHELGHRLWFKLMSKQQRSRVRERYRSMKNGNAIVDFGFGIDDGNDVFPSEYSTTSVEEFFSECFAYWRAHELCGSLSDFMEDIFIEHRNNSSSEEK